MPFAENGTVFSEPMPGAVEITFEQYQDAIEKMGKGYSVSVEGGAFELIPPQLPEDVPPTDEELGAIALGMRDKLLSEAATRIAPLQDAVDLGEATDAEVAALAAWKRYRVALNRLPDQVGYPNDIDWPAPPA